MRCLEQLSWTYVPTCVLTNHEIFCGFFFRFVEAMFKEIFGHKFLGSKCLQVQRITCCDLIIFLRYFETYSINSWRHNAKSYYAQVERVHSGSHTHGMDIIERVDLNPIFVVLLCIYYNHNFLGVRIIILFDNAITMYCHNKFNSNAPQQGFHVLVMWHWYHARPKKSCWWGASPTIYPGVN